MCIQKAPPKIELFLFNYLGGVLHFGGAFYWLENYSSMFLGLIDDKKIVAASLILVEKINMFKYAYAPKGFLIDYNNEYVVEEFTKQIKDYLAVK